MTSANTGVWPGLPSRLFGHVASDQVAGAFSLV